MQPPDIDQMAGRLRAITREGGSIEAAQVRLIGLDEIREAAGPRWPRMRERVRSGSLNILAQHTNADDVVIPAGDGFLVVLAEGSPGTTQQRCQHMRDALLAFYLGEEALASLRPEVNNHALSAEGLDHLIASSLREEQRVIARAVDGEIALAPVLTTHEQKIGAVLAAPVARTQQARRIAYNADFILDGRHHTAHDFLEFDIAILDAGLARVARWRERGHLGVVGVCVHASTMQRRRSREEYLHWLADVDPELRRTMFVSICEIERGTPLMSLIEWCSAMRTHAPRIWLDFHHEDHAIGSVGATGAWAAGFHLPALAGAQRSQRLRGQADFWARSLRVQGMRLVVHGFEDAPFLDEAGAHGVDLLTSDAHWPFGPVDDDALERATH